MSKRSKLGPWSLGVLGVVVLTALPLVGVAKDTGAEEGRRQLEARLPLGETRDFYRGLLSGLGYTIVAIHEPGPDAVAYEIRQGAQAALIQFELDAETQTAVDIAVLAPALATRVVERAAGSDAGLALWSEAEDWLPEAMTLQVAAGDRDTGEMRGLQFSERDQHRAAQLVQEVEALPPGYASAFYSGVLVRQGYQVQEQESGAEEERAFEVSKDGQTLAVRVRFDGQTGESVSIEASPLWREAMDTEQPQVVSAAESQPAVESDEKTEDPRAALHDTRGD